MARITNRIHDTVTVEVPDPACRNCHEGLNTHVEGQCLFDSTSWDPMTPEEHAAWVRTEIFGDFTLGHHTTVTGRLSSREPNIQSLPRKRRSQDH